MPRLPSRRRRWSWLGLAALPLWAAAGQAVRRMYAPHYPDIALHAGLALVARPRRVLAIAPHPGVLELHAGGTLYLMARAGSEITAAVLTAGEAGGGSRNLAEIRRREQEQAAAVLGYGRLVQLDLPDGGLTEHPRLGPAVAQAWDAAQPELVLAPDPRGLFPLAQPDAAAAGYAAAEAALGGAPGGGAGRAGGGTGPGPAVPQVPDAAARLGRAALVGARDRVVRDVSLLLYGTRRPNVLVDITEVLQEKVSAVKSHRSQLRGPDPLAAPAIIQFSRVFRRHTSAYHVEGFYRVL